MSFFKAEPAVILGVVQAVIALVVSFGLRLSGEQIGSIMAVSAAILALVVRQNVTPVAKPPQDPPSDKTPPTGTHRLLGVVAALALVACSAPPAKPPCDPNTAARLAAKCVLDVQTECVDRGVPEEDCIPLQECELAADERQRECLQ